MIASKKPGYVEKPKDKFVQKMCDFGNICEPLAAATLYKLYPLHMWKPGSLQYYDESCNLKGQPDLITMDLSGRFVPIEIKTRCWPVEDDFENAVPFQDANEVKEKYWIQLQVYMMLLASPMGVLLSYSKCHGYTLFVQRANTKLWDLIIKYCRDFWNEKLEERVKSIEKKEVLSILETSIKETRRIV
jgi:hypothetical protein